MKNIIKNLNLITIIKETSVRFPIPVLCTILATIFSYLAIAEYFTDEQFITRVIYFADAAFIALTGFILLKERGKFPLKYYWVTSFIILFFTLWHVFTQSLQNEALIFSLGILLTLTYVPFLRSEDNDRLQCNFNSALIANIILNIITVFILFGGISAIFASIKYLFQINLPVKIYAYIWAFAGCFFAPLYFLYKLPSNLNDDSELKYPKGLKFIIEYVLAPLLVAYIFILYLYSIKIAFTWSLPKGDVAYLVTSFGLVGAFTFIMLQPMSEKMNFFAEGIKKYFYHLFSIPLILLIVGTYVRVSNYGLTEERYALVLTTFWFLICFSYFTLRKATSLKIITVSLSVLFIMASFGPWGIFNVSAHSQKNRLEKILTDSGLFNDGKVVKSPDGKIPYADRKEITSIINYLVSSDKFSYIKPWFLDINLADNGNVPYKDRYTLNQKIFKQLGFEPVQNWDYSSSPSLRDSTVFYFYLNTDPILESGMLNVAGYQNFSYFTDIYLYEGKDWVKSVTPQPYLNGTDKSHDYIIELKNKQLDLNIKNKSGAELVFNLKELVQNLEKTRELGVLEEKENVIDSKDLPKMTLEKESNGIKAKIIVTRINGKKYKENNIEVYDITNFSFILFMTDSQN